MLSGVLCLLILIIFRKLKKNCLLYISDTASGNLPHGKFLSRKLPPIKLLPWWITPSKFRLPTLEILTRNIPSRVFYIFCFFITVNVSLILLKRLFCMWCIKKSVAYRPKWLHTQKKFCCSSITIGHYCNPLACFETFYLRSFLWGMRCYSIQSLTLKSSFSIGLLGATHKSTQKTLF